MKKNITLITGEMNAIQGGASRSGIDVLRALRSLNGAKITVYGSYPIATFINDPYVVWMPSIGLVSLLKKMVGLLPHARKAIRHFGQTSRCIGEYFLRHEWLRQDVVVVNGFSCHRMFETVQSRLSQAAAKRHLSSENRHVTLPTTALSRYRRWSSCMTR